jgi:hypothetical protein
MESSWRRRKGVLKLLWNGIQTVQKTGLKMVGNGIQSEYAGKKAVWNGIQGMQKTELKMLGNGA